LLAHWVTSIRKIFDLQWLFDVLTAKMHRIRFRLGSAPDPAVGAQSQRYPKPLSWISAVLLLREGRESKGRGRRNEGRRMVRRGGEREGKGKESGRRRRGGCPYNMIDKSTPKIQNPEKYPDHIPQNAFLVYSDSLTN